MKTRADYEEQVRGPGKFEQEQPWTPYFWELVMDGDGEDVFSDDEYDEDCRVDYTKFRIDGNDIELFPELEEYRGRELQTREDSQGFVISIII